MGYMFLSVLEYLGLSLIQAFLVAFFVRSENRAAAKGNSSPAIVYIGHWDGLETRTSHIIVQCHPKAK